MFTAKIKCLSDRKAVLDPQIQTHMRYIQNFPWRNPASESFYLKLFKYSPLVKLWMLMTQEIAKFQRHLRLAKIQFGKVKPDAREQFSELVDQARLIKIRDIVEPICDKGTKDSFCCPFHNEKVPSMKIYPKTNSFYCFGCNVGGDVIKFVMLYHNLDFKNAVRYLN